MASGNTFRYDSKMKHFALSYQNKDRVYFGDLEFNFRMTSMSLRLGRVWPGLRKDGKSGVRFPLVLWGMTSSGDASLSEPTGHLCVDHLEQASLISYANDSSEINFSPDQAVRLAITKIPDSSKGIFYHNCSNEFQNFDCEGLWWSQAVFKDDLSSELSHDWGMLSCWLYDDNTVGSILPVTTGNVLSRLRGDSLGLSIISCTGASGENIENYPMALMAFGDSVQETIDKLFVAATKVYPNFSLRQKKSLHKPFDKLGWCSWNAFGKDITEDKLIHAVESFKSQQIPVRYIIADDGWLNVEETKASKAIGEGISASRLRSFEPDHTKFPNGFAKVIEHAKDNGIESFGVWHALNGHWQGVISNTDFVAEHPDWFITADNGWVIPSPNSGFFKTWYAKMKEWGVDFLKIDNQGFHRQCLTYQYNLARYMAGVQNELRDASREQNYSIMYCMATHPEVYFNCLPDQLLRMSNDFIPNDSFGSRKHIVNNFYNSCWLGKIFWPDFDMFQTEDLNAETFSRMLAISGSPIYTTDKPENIDVEMIKRLVFPDGLIPTYNNLGTIMSSRFFDNPYANGNILAVSARTAHAITLGLFNTIETGQACSGQFSLEELGNVNKRCLAYSDKNQFSPRVLASNSHIDFSLKNMESDLITIAPIKDGFAVIGIVDYFAAPAIISDIAKTKNGWKISLKATGLLLGFCEREPEAILCDEKLLLQVESDPCPGQYCWEHGIFKAYANECLVEITVG